MKKIKLTQGQFAIVDDADFEWLNQRGWFAKLESSGKFYAVRKSPRPKQRIIFMHRVICGVAVGKQVDHKNGDSLDNRRKNLRHCVASENQWNRSVSRNNTSGFKGVYWDAAKEKWKAQIGVFCKRIFLGSFATAESAGKAYKIAARKYHGEFARTI